LGAAPSFLREKFEFLSLLPIRENFRATGFLGQLLQLADVKIKTELKIFYFNFSTRKAKFRLYVCCVYFSILDDFLLSEFYFQFTEKREGTAAQIHTRKTRLCSRGEEPNLASEEKKECDEEEEYSIGIFRNTRRR
jgi:hypothetical protein